MISSISNIICFNSTIIFDYLTYDDSNKTKINEQLAKGVCYCLAVKRNILYYSKKE